MGNWKKIKDIKVKQFLSIFEDEVLYIIPSGRTGEYIVVFDDAYEVSVGKTFVGNKEQIKEVYGIEL